MIESLALVIGQCRHGRGASPSKPTIRMRSLHSPHHGGRGQRLALRPGNFRVEVADEALKLPRRIAPTRIPGLVINQAGTEQQVDRGIELI